MTFHGKSWDARFNEMGDQAEQRFEQEFTELGLKFVRYGLNRPPISLARVPSRIRYSPDYLCHNRFVEVQGFGRDQLLKLKVDKWGALHWWRDVHPVDLFILDSHKDRTTCIPLERLDDLIDAGQCELRVFHEAKAYFAFAANDIFDPHEQEAA